MVSERNSRTPGRHRDGWRLSHAADPWSPGTPIPAFDQDRWVSSGHYDKRNPRQSVEQFRTLREANLALLKSLTPDQWQHHGVHSERGVETIDRIVHMFAGHDLNHL